MRPELRRQAALKAWETKRKNGTDHARKGKGLGNIPWNKGLTKETDSRLDHGPCPKERGIHISIAKYKGDAAKNGAKHMYLYVTFGLASHCENNPIHIGRRYNWANLDHKYTRDPNDYAQLCMSCHSLYDRGKISVLGKTIIERGYVPIRCGRLGIPFTEEQRKMLSIIHRTTCKCPRHQNRRIYKV